MKTYQEVQGDIIEEIRIYRDTGDPSRYWPEKILQKAPDLEDQELLKELLLYEQGVGGALNFF